jgi:hypothetical protein
MGFSKTAPPSAHARDVHSCVRPSRLPGRISRFGLPLPRTGPVPPSRFLTALTGFSVARAAGLLHPAADHGVHRVRRPRDLAVSRTSSTVRDPSKGFPHQQPPAFPGSCPLIVRHPRMARSRGLAPLVESVASLACCHAKEPDPPLGFYSSSLFRLTPGPGRDPEGSPTLLGGPAPLRERACPEGAEAVSRVVSLLLSGPSPGKPDGLRGAICGRRLRPRAGPQGLRVAYSQKKRSLSVPRGAERSDLLRDPHALCTPMKHRWAWRWKAG